MGDLLSSKQKNVVLRDNISFAPLIRCDSFLTSTLVRSSSPLPPSYHHHNSFPLFPTNDIKGKYPVAALMEFTFVASQSSPYFTE